MTTYRGKMNWGSIVQNEQFTIILPRGSSVRDDDPIHLYWSFSAGKKANLDQARICRVKDRGAGEYQFDCLYSIDDKYYFFDITSRGYGAELSVVIREESKSTVAPSSAMVLKRVNHVENERLRLGKRTQIYAGMLDFDRFCKHETFVVGLPYGLADGQPVNAHWMWTRTSQGSVHENVDSGDQTCKVQPNNPNVFSFKVGIDYIAEATVSNDAKTMKVDLSWSSVTGAQQVFVTLQLQPMKWYDTLGTTTTTAPPMIKTQTLVPDKAPPPGSQGTSNIDVSCIAIEKVENVPVTAAAAPAPPLPQTETLVPVKAAPPPSHGGQGGTTTAPVRAAPPPSHGGHGGTTTAAPLMPITAAAPPSHGNTTTAPPSVLVRAAPPPSHGGHGGTTTAAPSVPITAAPSPSHGDTITAPPAVPVTAAPPPSDDTTTTTTAPPPPSPGTTTTTIGTSGHNNFFYTNEIRPWTNPQLANSKPTTTWYSSTKYPIGLTIFDYDYQKDIRIKSYFDNVKFNETNQEFDATIHLDAWDDTIMYATECTWFDNVLNDRDFKHGKLTLKPDQLIQGASFPTEFASQPAVIVWLSGFDVGHTGDWRFSVNANSITTKGFQIVGEAWGTTKLNSMEATWIAYPASRLNIDSGRFDTNEVRGWAKPQHENSQKIVFQKNFVRVPRIYFAVNKIDSFHDNQFDLRLQAYITDTTTKGMTTHLDSWGQANMYSSSGQWIAIEDC